MLLCAVFSDKKLAEKFIDSFEKVCDEFKIEKRNLDPFTYELEKDYKHFFLRMKKDGTCTEIKIKDSFFGFENEKLDFGFCIYNNMYLSVFAKDEKHAIEIANEKRVQLIAENRWK